MNEELTRLVFDPFRLGPELNVNSKLGAFSYELIHQVWVELRQWARTAMHYSDLRSNTHRHIDWSSRLRT